MSALFFATPARWRAWLERSHDKAREVLVGFYKRDSGRPSITWPESVDEALCFGWIDGVRRRVDDQSYTIRFTPRRPGSTWSAINIKRVRELTKLGLVQAAGVKAFEGRRADKSGIYSYEQRRSIALSPAFARRVRANRKAWDFWNAQPPWYRRATTHWIMSAKQTETRERRLASLIEDSAAGRMARPFIPREGGGARRVGPRR